MAVKFKLNSREEIPADLTNHYVERDGAFLLFESNAGGGAVGGGFGGAVTGENPWKKESFNWKQIAIAVNIV